MEAILLKDICHEKFYSYAHTASKNDCIGVYHTHQSLEIYMQLKGIATYYVENEQYRLTPYDIILVGYNEKHCVAFENDECERIIVGLNDAFFIENHCDQYKSIFIQSTHSARLIPSLTVRNFGIQNVMIKIGQYRADVRENSDIVVKCAIVELLYLLSKAMPDYLGQIKTKQNLLINEILSYINQNVKRRIPLEEISKQFYVSRSALCKLFKRNTGMTIHQYITQLRIIRVMQLVRDGCTLGEACTQFGFSDYSNFYRAYVKLIGTPPRQTLYEQIRPIE